MVQPITQFNSQFKQLHDVFNMSVIDMQHMSDNIIIWQDFLSNHTIREMLQTLADHDDQEVIMLCQLIESNFYMTDEPLVNFEEFDQLYDICSPADSLLNKLGVNYEQYFIDDCRAGIIWYNEAEAAEIARERILNYLYLLDDKEDIIFIAEELEGLNCIVRLKN